MDDGGGEKQSRRQGPRPPSDRPRGRGLGAPTKTVFKCSRCGQSLAVAAATPFEATCSGCGEDIHTCTNCSHFDTAARFECRQEIEQPVSPKARRNQCELFEPKTVQVFDTDKPAPDDARAAFDSLFDL